MGTELEAPPEVRRIVDGLRGGEFGSLRVLAIRSRIGEDSDGARALFLDVTLPDPEGDTWRHEEVLELRRRLRDLAIESSLGIPYYLVLQPETEGEQEEDQADEDSDTSG